MKKILKHLFPELLLKLRVINLLVLNKNSFLYTTGWMRSVEQIKPIDAKGNPIPWMNYSFVEFITPRLKPNFNIFEYGSGNSSIYFAKYVNKVVSVEHNSDWFKLIKSVLPANASIMHVQSDTNGHYANAPLTLDRKFHMIIVDADDRTNCLFKAIDALTPDGVLLLDDSHSEADCGDLNTIFNGLKNRGFNEITFSGIKPFSNTCYSTTIFYRQTNCLGI